MCVYVCVRMEVFGSSAESAFALFSGGNQETKRTGWVNNGVKNPESVSDHMHRMAIISFLVGGDESDRSK